MIPNGLNNISKLYFACEGMTMEDHRVVLVAIPAVQLNASTTHA